MLALTLVVTTILKASIMVLQMQRYEPIYSCERSGCHRIERQIAKLCQRQKIAMSMFILIFFGMETVAFRSSGCQ